MAPLALDPARAENAPPPESRVFLDDRGVDLMSLSARVPGPTVSIGNLTYAGYFDTASMTWRHNFAGGIQSSGATYTVTLFGSSQKFQLVSGVYNALEGQTSTLTYNSGTNDYTLLLADGSTAVFDKDLSAAEPLQANEGLIASFTRPSGEATSFTYHTLSTGSGGKRRLQSVSNNFGYQIKFEYAGNSDNADGQRLVKVTGINNAVDYCDPTANGCSSLTQTWPSVTFSVSGNVTTVTDTIGLVTTYTNYMIGGAGSYAVERPRKGSLGYAFADGDGKVTEVYEENTGYEYELSEDSPSQTTVWVHAEHTGGYDYMLRYNPATKLTTEFQRRLNPHDSYTYDGNQRISRKTTTYGTPSMYVDYTYDARGNVLETVHEPGGTLLDGVETSAEYPSTCSNVVTCNLPTSVTNERGGVTQFTYDSTHGGVTKVTLPAPSSGADRPETRTSYAQFSAWIKNSGGTFTQASAVWLPTQTSSCRVGDTDECVGTADEFKTAITYPTGSSSLGSNLLPVSVTKSSGETTPSISATISTTYNHLSQPLTVDGPLSGSADTVTTIYDVKGRVVGIVEPDPDAGGSLEHRATRNVYSSTTGLLDSVEIGSVDSPVSFTSTFTTKLKTEYTYDAAGQVVREDLIGDATPQRVTQYGYSGPQLVCKTVRMSLTSIPSTCDASTSSDRHTWYEYDSGGRLVLTANNEIGQVEQRIYQAGPLLLGVAGPRGEKTTYEYDGFMRLSKVRYPDPTQHGVSSTTDYEQYTYDAASNVTSFRRRDGTTICTTFDALNRPWLQDVPDCTELDTETGYDNFGNVVAVEKSGHTVGFGFDALGRTTTATSPQGTVTYGYNAADQRLSMMWPDSFQVNYAYDVAGNLVSIAENGGITLATFAYDDLGRRTSLTRGASAGVTTYDYDDASLLSELFHDLPSTGGDLTKEFAYNRDNQIVGATLDNTGYAPAPVVSETLYGRDFLNRYTTIGSNTPTYDARMNMTRDGVKTYTYDALNRLTGAGGVALTYDPLDRLHQTTSTTSVVTRFLYDGVDLIAEYNGSNVLQRRYVHGPSTDEPIVWYEGSDASDRRWFVADELGSVVGVVDDGVTTKNTYDEYGAPASGNLGRFQYTGQVWLPETGLYHYKARAYHPGLGRFLQTDPIGYEDGLNSYAYVGNDPVNFLDPSGLVKIHEQDPIPERDPKVEAARRNETGENNPTPPRDHGNSSTDDASASGWGDGIGLFGWEVQSGVSGGMHLGAAGALAAASPLQVHNTATSGAECVGHPNVGLCLWGTPGSREEVMGSYIAGHFGLPGRGGRYKRSYGPDNPPKMPGPKVTQPQKQFPDYSNPALKDAKPGVPFEPRPIAPRRRKFAEFLEDFLGMFN